VPAQRTASGCGRAASPAVVQTTRAALDQRAAPLDADREPGPWRPALRFGFDVDRA